MNYSYNKCVTCKLQKVLHFGQCLDCGKKSREEAAKHLGAHWETKITRGQEHLGPPGLPSYVRGIDVLGYWPLKPYDPK